jgi:hypothetical protein
MKRLLAALLFATLVSLCALSDDASHTTVVDTQSMPWQRGGIRLSKNWALKILEDDTTTGRRVALAYLPPGLVSHEGRHYHQFRQWFYFLHGDIPVFDFTSPEQKKARMNILREGYFLDRPAVSMHGDGEESDPRPQAGSMFLMWLENSLPSKKVPPEGPYPEGTEYRDDRIVDTRAMDWSKESDGSMTKTLASNVRLVFLPPGWSGSRAPSSLLSAFVIYGSGALHASGADFTLRDGSYLRQPAGESAKVESGDVGCMLLEWYEAPLTGVKK